MWNSKICKLMLGNGIIDIIFMLSKKAGGGGGPREIS